MRISDWSSDVCSSDLYGLDAGLQHGDRLLLLGIVERGFRLQPVGEAADFLETALQPADGWRRLAVADFLRQPVEQVGAFDDATADRRHHGGLAEPAAQQIGRESGRERGGQYV